MPFAIDAAALPLCRRKLHDACLRSNLVGNTEARSLLSADEAALWSKHTNVTGEPLRCLYAAVGDVRCALSTVADVAGAGGAIELSLNDSSDLAVARAALTLYLASIDEDAAAAAAWCDAWLGDKCQRKVLDAMAALLRQEQPAWLEVQGVDDVFLGWIKLSSELTATEAEGYRNAALIANGCGHGRAGASPTWRQKGVSTVDSETSAAYDKPNVTLYDVRQRPPAFLETTGPASAFAELRNLESGSVSFGAALKKAWKKRFTALRLLVGRKALRVECSVSGESTALRQGRKYDVIDTSNVADYAGLWNVLLANVPALTVFQTARKRDREDGEAAEVDSLASLRFVQTEHVVTVAASLDAVFSEEMPFEKWGHGKLLKYCGWRVFASTKVHALEHDAPRDPTDKEEKVVRVRWGKCRGAEEKVFEPLRSQKSNEFRAILSDCIHRCAPLPMNHDMLEDPTQPIEASYVWPKSTMATIVQLAVQASARSRVAKGALEALLDCEALREEPYVRNLALSLLVEVSLRRPALRVASPRLRFQRKCFDGVAWYQAHPEFYEEDLLQHRGGIFEAALGLLLVHDDALLEVVERAGTWEKAEDGEMMNILHEWLSTEARFDQVQLLDRVHFDADKMSISIALPTEAPKGFDTFFPIREHFHHAILIDVQAFDLLAEPMALADFE